MNTSSTSILKKRRSENGRQTEEKISRMSRGVVVDKNLLIMVTDKSPIGKQVLDHIQSICDWLVLCNRLLKPPGNRHLPKMLLPLISKLQAEKKAINVGDPPPLSVSQVIQEHLRDRRCEDDIYLVATAVAGEAELIVTCDKTLLKTAKEPKVACWLKKLRVSVISPEDYLMY